MGEIILTKNKSIRHQEEGQQRTVCWTLERPPGLRPEGNEAYDVIMRVLQENDALFTGGCKTFYSPQEWRERGEKWDCDSLLVVVYDGGDVGEFFSYDKAFDCTPKYERHTKMHDALLAEGFFFEEGMCWYGGVYLI